VPLATRLEIVAQVAEALEAAHSVGVLHKDLKPANILIREETSSGKPRACLTDFGIGLVTSKDALSGQGVTSMGLTETLLSSSSTSGAGTRLYMAPEVIEGKPATPQSDIYALGVLLYQMVGGDFSHSLAPGWEREVGDESLLADITECVDGDPERRLSNASELAERLRALGTRQAQLRTRRTRRLLLRSTAALAALLLVGLFGARLLQQRAKVRWAHEIAIPRIQQLTFEEAYLEAFALAEEARLYLPNDPTLKQMRERVSGTISVHTEPAGAEVFARPYSDIDAAWQSLGPTPLSELRLPLGLFRWRIEKPGYEPVEIARFVKRLPKRVAIAKRRGLAGNPTFDIDLGLSAVGSLPQGMIAVEEATRATSVSEESVRKTMARFLLDRTETTNAQYKQFVDAGGYLRPEYWKEPFVRGGRTLSFSEAMDRFRDATGRPGPATWMLGDFPEGTADHPVGGVSWFEASAYAAFRGKDLPTVHHWHRAAEFPEPRYDVGPALIRQSNIGSSGPTPVASRPGISISGAYDMAGNVREWSSTALGDGRILNGGAWNDASYEFRNQNSHSPWERAPQNGLRCVQYLTGDGLDHWRKPVVGSEIDIQRAMEFSFSDEVWRAVLPYFAGYSPGALNPTLERVEEAPSGSRIEWVSIDAAYGGERVLLRLHLPPEEFPPPHQGLLYFPGSMGFQLHSLEENGEETDKLDFLTRHGRVLVEIALAGMFERNAGRAGLSQDDSRAAGEFVRKWRLDVARAIDYLEARDDIKGDALAYIGLSLGASMSPFMLSGEERFRAAVSWAGGLLLARQSRQGELEQMVGHAKRCTAPLLMLNGRYDASVRVEMHQKPFLAAWGAAEQDKRHVLFDGGHFNDFPPEEFAREITDWLDRYLGPVPSESAAVVHAD
jgi:serine/threonine protein kinase